MKAIAYSIKSQEKEHMVLANGKRHDLTLISNQLDVRTVAYAQGKEIVIISPYDILDREMLWELKHAGVRKIVTRSRITTHIDLVEATRMGFQIANVPDGDQSERNVAKHIIRNLDAWESGKCVGKACCCQRDCARSERDETLDVSGGNHG